MSRLYLILPLLSCFILTLIGAPAHAFDARSIRNLQKTWGYDVRDVAVSVTTDAKLVSSGRTGVLIQGKSGDRKGNHYLGAKFSIPRTDISKRLICVTAKSTFPSSTNAVYVRFYDGQGKKIASWNN